MAENSDSVERAPGDGVVDRFSDAAAVLQHEVDGLHAAMASRAKIEQAKGMLMLRYGIEEDAAFGMLRRWSSVHNVKLRTVAAALIEACVQQPTEAGLEIAPERLVAAALSSQSGDGKSETPVQQ